MIKKIPLLFLFCLTQLNVNATVFEIIKDGLDNSRSDFVKINELASNPIKNKFNHITYNFTIKTLVVLNVNFLKYHENSNIDFVSYDVYYTFSPTLKLEKTWSFKKCNIDVWTKSTFDSDTFKLNEFNHQNISAEVGYTITF